MYPQTGTQNWCKTYNTMISSCATLLLLFEFPKTFVKKSPLAPVDRIDPPICIIHALGYEFTIFLHTGRLAEGGGSG